jgi:hypothetical protein
MSHSMMLILNFEIQKWLFHIWYAQYLKSLKCYSMVCDHGVKTLQKHFGPPLLLDKGFPRVLMLGQIIMPCRKWDKNIIVYIYIYSKYSVLSHLFDINDLDKPKI